MTHSQVLPNLWNSFIILFPLSLISPSPVSFLTSLPAILMIESGTRDRRDILKGLNDSSLSSSDRYFHLQGLTVMLFCLNTQQHSSLKALSMSHRPALQKWLTNLEMTSLWSSSCFLFIIMQNKRARCLNKVAVQTFLTLATPEVQRTILWVRLNELNNVIGFNWYVQNLALHTPDASHLFDTCN